MKKTFLSLVILLMFHNCKSRNSTRLDSRSPSVLDDDPVQPIHVGARYNMTKFLSNILNHAKMAERRRRKKAMTTTTPGLETNYDFMTIDNIVGENGEKVPIMRQGEREELTYDLDDGVDFLRMPL